MANDLEPVIGEWYEDDEGRSFEVVAVHAATAKVEIQYLDGEIEEISPQTWDEMDLQPAVPPEDAVRELTAAERDELDDIEAATRREERGGPWSETESEE